MEKDSGEIPTTQRVQEKGIGQQSREVSLVREEEKRKIFHENAARLFPRLKKIAKN